jgi:hypothetical protein
MCLLNHSQVRDYLLALESHLSEAHRQASRLTAKEVELGEAVLEFGQVRKHTHFGWLHACAAACVRAM